MNVEITYPITDVLRKTGVPNENNKKARTERLIKMIDVSQDQAIVDSLCLPPIQKREYVYA